MSFINRRKRAGEDKTTAAAETKLEFERLALPLIESLFNFACWLTRNQEEAEDLVQETYMKAWSGFGLFRGESTLRTWIFRILRNAFLSSRKDAYAARAGGRGVGRQAVLRGS